MWTFSEHCNCQHDDLCVASKIETLWSSYINQGCFSLKWLSARFFKLVKVVFSLAMCVLIEIVISALAAKIASVLCRYTVHQSIPSTKYGSDIMLYYIAGSFEWLILFIIVHIAFSSVEATPTSSFYFLSASRVPAHSPNVLTILYILLLLRSYN